MNNLSFAIYGFCGFFASLQVIASEDVLVQLGDLPGRTVKLINTSVNNIVLELKEDAGKSSSDLVSQGRYPYKIAIYKEETYTTKTGEKKVDGKFSIERTLDKSVSFAEKSDGSRIEIPSKRKNMIGATIVGRTDSKGNMKVNDISGGSINESQKALYLKAFQLLPVLSEPAPLKPLKVGDHFSAPLNVSLPLPDNESVNIEMTIFYTLNQIVSNIAHFNIRMDFGIQSPKAKISNGSASGLFEYNHISRLLIREELNWSIEAETSKDNVNYVSKMSVKSSMTQEIMDD